MSEIVTLRTRIDDLECTLAELREALDGVADLNDPNLTLMSGLTVYYPADRHGNVIVVAASGARLPVIAIPPRPTVREWAGILQNRTQWPSDIPSGRAENLLLRVIDPHLGGVPVDLLDAKGIEQAVTAARLTDDERSTARRLLEFAVSEAVAGGKAPAL